MAFTAGRTVLTPTSHGNSKQSPDYWVIYGEIYLNMTIVIEIYDACHDGANVNKLNKFYKPNLYNLLLLHRHDTAIKGGKGKQWETS